HLALAGGEIFGLIGPVQRRCLRRVTVNSELACTLLGGECTRALAVASVHAGGGGACLHREEIERERREQMRNRVERSAVAVGEGTRMRRHAVDERAVNELSSGLEAIDDIGCAPEAAHVMQREHFEAVRSTFGGRVGGALCFGGGGGQFTMRRDE